MRIVTRIVSSRLRATHFTDWLKTCMETYSIQVFLVLFGHVGGVVPRAQKAVGGGDGGGRVRRVQRVRVHAARREHGLVHALRVQLAR